MSHHMPKSTLLDKYTALLNDLNRCIRQSQQRRGKKVIDRRRGFLPRNLKDMPEGALVQQLAAQVPLPKMAGAAPFSFNYEKGPVRISITSHYLEQKTNLARYLGDIV
jgi:hypothetical protein